MNMYYLLAFSNPQNRNVNVGVNQIPPPPIPTPPGAVPISPVPGIGAPNANVAAPQLPHLMTPLKKRAQAGSLDF